jgi:hypothetical protein
MVPSKREQRLKKIKLQRSADFDDPKYELYKQYFAHVVPRSIKAIYELKSELGKGVHNHNYVWVQYFNPLNLSTIQASSIYINEYYCFGVDEDGQSLLIKVKNGQQNESIYIDFDVGNGENTDVEETELQLPNLLKELVKNG